VGVIDWFEDQCLFIDDLIASGKIDRFPVEAEIIPYLTDAFGLTPNEAAKILREWERRKGRR
jgi:hypothetical protein